MISQYQKRSVLYIFFLEPRMFFFLGFVITIKHMDLFFKIIFQAFEVGKRIEEMFEKRSCERQMKEVVYGETNLF